MVSFSLLNKGEKDVLLPRLFDLLYENMKDIAPSSVTYDVEKAMFLANVSPALNKAPRQILLALEGVAPVGYIQYYTRKELLMIEEVQIRKDHQGTLLFLCLCRQLLKLLPNEIRVVEAYADPRNLRSICLMKKLGMRDLQESGDYAHLRGDGKLIRKKLMPRENPGNL